MQNQNELNQLSIKEYIRRIIEKFEKRILKNNNEIIARNGKMLKKLDIIIAELPAKAAVDREQNDRLDIIEERLNIGFVAT